MQMAGNLTWFWDMRGSVPEARTCLNATLAVAPTDSPSRPQALFASGRMALIIGELEEARSRLLGALPLARQTGDERLVVLILSHLAWAAESTDRAKSARCTTRPSAPHRGSGTTGRWESPSTTTRS